MTRIRRQARAWQVAATRPSARLRLAALGAALVVTWLSLAGPVGDATASSDRSPVSAWWTAANVGHGIAVPGTLIGASGKQLLVEGSNALPPVAGVSNAPLSSLAVAAMRWKLAPGEVPTSLSLAVAGSPPPFVTVQACRITGSFDAVYGGPYADVPSYSCAHAVDGVMKGSRLEFSGIGKLAAGNELSVLLVPGPLDRVVLAPPTLRSLFVSAAPVGKPGRHHSNPAIGTPPAPPVTTDVPEGAPGPLPSIPAAPQTGPAANPPAPVVAGVGDQAQPVALAKPLPGWRRWLAAGVIALEVLVFLATRRSVVREATPGRGIGRFVAERDGPPIRL